MKITISPHEYINDYKSMLVYPKKYPDKFENLYKLVKNRLECNENSLFRLQYGLSFSRSLDDVYFKNIHKNWPLFSIEQYNLLIEFYLELIGFKKYVKDYVLICSYSLYEFSSPYSSQNQLEKFVRFYFNVLFDKPNFSNINNIDLNNDYFNDKLFNVQSEQGANDSYYWLQLSEFTDEFAYQLFCSIEKGEITINNNLKLDDFIKLKNNVILKLKNLYLEKGQPLFSGSFSGEDLDGYEYFTEKDVLSGRYFIKRKKFGYTSFFRYRLPWINFVLGWESRTFNDSKIISSDLSITFNGNCKYLLETNH